MTELLHANFGWFHAPPFPPACCHCLIIRSEAMQAAGFQFIESVTVLAQIQQLETDDPRYRSA